MFDTCASTLTFSLTQKKIMPGCLLVPNFGFPQKWSIEGLVNPPLVFHSWKPPLKNKNIQLLCAFLVGIQLFVIVFPCMLQII